MKILLIDVNYKNSSTGQIVYNIHKYNLKNNNDSAICFGRGKKSSDSNVYKFGLDFETYFHAFMTRLTGLMGYYSFFSTKRLIKFIKKYKPDIVHIHELHSYFVNYIALLVFLKKENIPTLFTLHCEFNYTGKCGHGGECTKYTEGCGHCPKLKEYPISLFFDKTHHMWEAKYKVFKDWTNYYVSVPSFWLRKRAENSFLGEHIIQTVHNGIDTSIFYLDKDCMKKDVFNTDKKVILSIAPNITTQAKGGKHIFEIANQFINLNYIFVLVGCSDTNIEHPDNVVLLSPTSDKNLLRRYYSTADLFLICSENENFPTTCLEAQCCGLKIAGFDVGGINETACHPSHMVLKPYGDISGISSVIKDMTTIEYNKEDVSNISIKNLSTDQMCQAYLKIYKDIVDA